MTSQNTSACLINDENKGIKGFKGMKHLLIIGAACWLGACSNTPPVSTTWEAYTQPKEQKALIPPTPDSPGIRAFLAQSLSLAGMSDDTEASDGHHMLS